MPPLQQRQAWLPWNRICSERPQFVLVTARNLSCPQTILNGLEVSLGLGDGVTAPSWQAKWPLAYVHGVISDGCQGNPWPFGVR